MGIRRWAKRQRQKGRVPGIDLTFEGYGKYQERKSEKKAREGQDAAAAAAAAAQSPEAQLAQMELDELKRQAGEREQFLPYLYASQGYELDEEGNLMPLSEEGAQRYLTPQQRSALELERLATERSLKGVRGELEIDPAFERDITRERGRTKEEIFRQLGSGGEISDPGSRKLAELSGRAAVLRSQLRHGEISTAEAIAGGRRGQMTGTASQISGITDPFRALSVGGDALSRIAGIRQTEAERHHEAVMNRRNLIPNLVGSVAGIFSK